MLLVDIAMGKVGKREMHHLLLLGISQQVQCLSLFLYHVLFQWKRDDKARLSGRGGGGGETWSL